MAPPASLISLPTEVLAQIISLVDQNSLVALKSVSRALTGLDDRRLWEHLHLTLPRYSGARPFILPPPRDVCGEQKESVNETDRRAWLEMEADMCERRYEDAAARQSQANLKDRGCPHIRSGQVDFIHANLQSLNIIAAPLHPSTVWDGDVRMPNYEFRVYDIDFPSSFPLLTHLHMSSLTSLDGDLVTTLCNLAPNLLSLDLHFGTMARIFAEEGGARYPLTSHTKLRRLRFAWDKRLGGGDDLSAELFASLLYNSPDLQQVIVSFGDSTEERLLVRLLDALEEHPEVQDLRWPVVESLTGCAKLRRLVVESHAFGTKLVVVPNIPSVETFYIEAPPSTNRPHVVDFPENPDQYPSPLTFAYWAGILRLFPILGMVRPLSYTFHTDKVDLFDKLDDLERTSPTSSGVVSSIRYGEDEVMSMRFPRTYEQFEDRLKTADARSYAWPEYSTVIYRSFPVDPSLPPLIRERIFRLQEPQFCKLSDYRGKLVPAEIMQRVQEVAGDRVLDWDKRGVEVESDVWAVLQGWYRAL